MGEMGVFDMSAMIWLAAGWTSDIHCHMSVFFVFNLTFLVGWEISECGSVSNDAFSKICLTIGRFYLSIKESGVKSFVVRRIIRDGTNDSLDINPFSNSLQVTNLNRKY